MKNNIFNHLSGEMAIEESINTDHMPELLNHIFDIMRGKCNAWGYTFKTQEDIDMAKRVWMLTLCEEKITGREQLNFGIKKLMKSPMTFIPDVCDFIKLCKPSAEDLGLPDVEAAYKVSCYNAKGYNTKKLPWKHNAARYAAELTGGHELNNKPQKDTFPVYKRHYELIVEEISMGTPEEAIFPDYFERDGRTHKLEEMSRAKFQPYNDEEIEKWANGEKVTREDYNKPDEAMTKEEFDAEKPNWKPGYVFPKYAHLTSADKALPVIYKILEAWQKKQEEARKVMRGAK